MKFAKYQLNDKLFDKKQNLNSYIYDTQMNQQSEKLVADIIDEIMADHEFLKFVDKNVSDLISHRRKRPAPKEGYRYKRDWYDRLSDEGNVTTRFFTENIKSVWMKNSKLSSEVRKVVLFIGDKSLHETTLLRQERKEKAGDQD